MMNATQVVPLNTALLELRLLQAEVAELVEAVNSGAQHNVLDEVVDVLYRARAVAVGAGVSVEMLDEHAHFKTKLRSHIGKDTNLEECVARGIIAAYS